jgi:type I restriction enzyme M protein
MMANGSEQLLFSEDLTLPDNLPCIDDLKPTRSLSNVFEECHNYIYANEGMLKDKIFNEIVKILVMKVYDEKKTRDGNLRFGITSEEYKREVLDGCGQIFKNRLSNLLVEVQKEYPGLLDKRELSFQIRTIAYLVGRLQFLSLERTEADVKGEAFQAFISRHQRGDRGEFFTPYPIVKMAVELIEPKENERVIDPACGSGGFLVQTISYVRSKITELNVSEYIKRNIRGIEFNPDIAVCAMLRAAFEGGSGMEIACRNALLQDDEEGAFDVVLTNPPFGSRGKIKDKVLLDHYILARKWKKTNNAKWHSTNLVLNGQSPDILFIEKCMSLLHPGGRMGIVLPDGLLHNPSSGYVRAWVRSQAHILAVISIPQEAFIPYGTGIKTSLVLLQKKPIESKNYCLMARVNKIGYDVKGQPVYKRDDKGCLCRDKNGQFLIDNDIEAIVDSYQSLNSGDNKIDKSESIYVLKEDLLNLRLDVEHYNPKDISLILNLRKQGAKRLGDIVEIIKEPVHSIKKDEEIRYIAISDVDARTMQVVSQQKIKGHEAPSRATYKIKNGDIITAVSGASTGTTRQATAFITEDEDGAICTNGFAVLRNASCVIPYFLLAYMRTEYYLRQVRRLMTGHAIPNISLDDLADVLIPVPPIEKQEQISRMIERVYQALKNARKTSEEVIADTENLVACVV